MNRFATLLALCLFSFTALAEEGRAERAITFCTAFAVMAEDAQGYRQGHARVGDIIPPERVVVLMEDSERWRDSVRKNPKFAESFIYPGVMMAFLGHGASVSPTQVREAVLADCMRQAK